MPTHEIVRDGEPMLVGTGTRRLHPHDEAVLAALRAAPAHPTVAELHEAVRRRYPRMGLATVYRALQRLETAGLAMEVARDSLGRRYDARVERHDHAICATCGRVIDIATPTLPEEALASLLAAAQAAGLDASSYEIRVYGSCAACRQSRTGDSGMQEIGGIAGTLRASQAENGRMGHE